MTRFLISCAVALLVGCSSSHDEDADEAEYAEQGEESAIGSNPEYPCLSAWDGSQPFVVDAVKAEMNDPDSFEHIETRIGPDDDGQRWVFIMKFRGTNAYGAKIVDEVSGTYDPVSCEPELYQ